MIIDKDLLGVHKPLDFKGNAGVGHVIIPVGMKRDEYIENCYRTQTVAIQGGYGYSEFGCVRVAQAVMQEIEFPSGSENDSRFGSTVVWIKDSNSLAPIIIATLRRQDNYYRLDEHTRRIAVGLEGGSSVELFMTGDGQLQISVVGSETSSAQMNLRVSSPKGDSKVAIDCDNEVLVNAGKAVRVLTPGMVEARFVDSEMEEKTIIRYELQKGLTYKDEFENEITAKDGMINLRSKEISHNEGSEPMVLGDTLKDILSDFLDGIMKLTVVTPVGTSSPPVNIQDFAKIKAQLDNIKSKKSKLE